MKPPPFARRFVPTNTPHRFESSNEWNELPICCRCRCLEGTLLESCPVQALTMAEMDLAYRAFLIRDDYRAGSFEDYNKLVGQYNDRLLDEALSQRSVLTL